MGGSIKTGTAFYILFRKGREREEEKRNDKYQITMCKKSLHSGAPRLFGFIVPENMKLAGLDVEETA